MPYFRKSYLKITPSVLKAGEKMKKNKLTPGHNLLWESSRMMLPEHREQFLEHRRELSQKTKPLLDEQEQDHINHTLFNAYHHKRSVTLTLFDPLDHVIRQGAIHTLDPEKKRLKLEEEDGQKEWIPLERILNVTLD